MTTAAVEPTQQATAQTEAKKVPVVRTLAKSLREYTKPSILSPLFVAVEGILEII